MGVTGSHGRDGLTLQSRSVGLLSKYLPFYHIIDATGERKAPQLLHFIGLCQCDNCHGMSFCDPLVDGSTQSWVLKIVGGIGSLVLCFFTLIKKRTRHRFFKKRGLCVSHCQAYGGTKGAQENKKIGCSCHVEWTVSAKIRNEH